MSVCVEITSEGFLKTTGTELCSSFVLVSSAEYQNLSSHQSVSAQDASMAIGFGFAVVLGLGYLSTYGVALAKRLINLV